MPCNIKNPANINLGDLEPHINGMYDYFDQKIGFKKPPTMVFDSDPSNQHKVLGKTAYYDPDSLEIHIYSDGRHPKDMLRSIAHELIHHQQNLEDRLDVGGYHGEGYYLENKELKKLEHEAMLKGNALMREYEDTLKRKENKEMSLNEWKNNELNRLLMKKFGLLNEKLGDGKTQGTDSVEAGLDNNKEFTRSDLAAEKGGARGDDKKKSDEENEKETNEGVVPASQGEYDEYVKKHGKKKKDKKEDDKEDEDLEEGRRSPREENSDKFAGHEDRYYEDRMHEADEIEDDMLSKKDAKESTKMDSVGPANESLKESIRKVLKQNKKLRLRFKR